MAPVQSVKWVMLRQVGSTIIGIVVVEFRGQYGRNIIYKYAVQMRTDRQGMTIDREEGFCPKLGAKIIQAIPKDSLGLPLRSFG